MSSTNEYHMGHADIRIDGDRVFVRLHGGLSLEQLAQQTELMKELHLRRDKQFILVDMREGQGLPPAVRRAFSQMLSDFDPAALAVFGANMEQRGSHALLMGAVAVVSGRRLNVAYFSTEAEAQKWLDEEHARLHPGS